MRTRRAEMAVISAVLLVLTACADNETPAGSAPTTPETTATTPTTSAPAGQTSPTTGGAGTRVEVTENEYSITLPRTELTPGSYTFVVANQGGAPHDLAVKGPGVDSAKTEVLDGGGQAELTVTLQPGTYELWCTVGNHRERGMELTVTVSG